MIKTVGVIGGSGYLGSVLVPMLLNAGYKVNVLDLMLFGNTLKKNSNLNIFKGDMRNLDLVEKFTKNTDAIIHLACISNDPSFELNPNLGKSINYDCFEPIVKCAKINNVKRFIYASSSSVYGIKEIPNVSENEQLNPITDYSKYKALCEKILKKYSSDDFVTTSVRSATLCGYSSRQRLDLIVNIFCNFAFNKKKIDIYGGTQLRPNIHIEDTSRFYLCLLKEKKEKINAQEFNIGNKNYPISEIAEIVKNVYGKEIKLNYTKTDDLRSYHISSKKAESVLNFKCKKTIQDAINDLKKAFMEGKLINTFENEKYYNVKVMKKLNLS